MIFFDIDNTLINYDASEEISIIILYKEMSGVLLDKKQVEYWHMISQKYFDEYLKGIMSFDEQGIIRIKDMSKNCNLGIDESSAMNWFDKYQKILSCNWMLFDDVLDTLKFLKNKRLGIISNGNAKQQSQKLLCTNIDSYFEIKVFSGEVGYAKPSHCIFKNAISQANEDAENVVYVGDNVRTDIMPCMQLGIKSILIDRNNKYNSVENRIFNLKDVSVFLEKWQL